MSLSNHGTDTPLKQRPGNRQDTDTELPLGRIRQIALVATGVYLASLSPFVLLDILGARERGVVTLAAQVPLFVSGAVYARMARRRHAARMARFWRWFAWASTLLAAGFGLWAVAVRLDEFAIAVMASVLLVASMPLFLGALIGRLRSLGTFQWTRIELIDAAIFTFVVTGYVGMFIAQPVWEELDLPLAILLCGGTILTGVTLYVLLLLLRRGGPSVRKSERFMLVPLLTIELYLLVRAGAVAVGISGGTELFLFGSLVATAPLPLTPLFDSGATGSRVDMSDTAERRPQAIVVVAISAIPLLLFIALFDIQERWRLALAGTVLTAVVTLVAVRQYLMVREIQGLLKTRKSLAAAWESQAAKSEALLVLLRRVAEGRELVSILEAALEAAVRTTNATRGAFLVRDRGVGGSQDAGSHVEMALGLEPAEIEEINRSGFNPVSIFRGAKTGRTVRLRGEPIPVLSETSAAFCSKSSAAVAITGWADGGIGALVCDAGNSEVEFTDEDLEMLEAIVDHISLDLSRNRLFKELADSEERYRMLVEDATDGVCELDLDDRILFTNSAFAEMVGLHISAIAGKRLEEVLTIDSDRVDESDGIREIHARAEREDGETAILEVRTSVRRDGRVQAVARDVTERQRAAERIAALVEELEEKRRARTEALARMIRAIEDERTRVAADIHDGPVQELSTLAIKLDVARAKLQRGEDAERLLREIRDSLSQEVLHLRNLMMELRPPVLDERGLFEAIDNYARGFEVETGISVDVRRVGDLSCEKTVETVLYRIIQESLSNVRKHSFAREVEIELAGYPDGKTTLRIADDGIGFEVTSTRSALANGHIGLASIAERAELAGGSATIRSAPGEGTEIVVEIGAEVVTDAGS